MKDLFGIKRRRATISSCGKYRYKLERLWDETKPSILFVMLNPSTADADIDDATIRRCVAFANKWGYGRLLVGNLFAWRSTSPTVLYHDSDQKVGELNGSLNDECLKSMAAESDCVVFAWGNYGMINNRAEVVSEMFPQAVCLGINSTGQPKHPLYVKGDTSQINYK